MEGSPGGSCFCGWSLGSLWFSSAISASLFSIPRRTGRVTPTQTYLTSPRSSSILINTNVWLPPSHAPIHQKYTSPSTQQMRTQTLLSLPRSSVQRHHRQPPGRSVAQQAGSWIKEISGKCWEIIQWIWGI